MPPIVAQKVIASAKPKHGHIDQGDVLYMAEVRRVIEVYCQTKESVFTAVISPPRNRLKLAAS